MSARLPARLPLRPACHVARRGPDEDTGGRWGCCCHTCQLSRWCNPWCHTPQHPRPTHPPSQQPRGPGVGPERPLVLRPRQPHRAQQHPRRGPGGRQRHGHHNRSRLRPRSLHRSPDELPSPLAGAVPALAAAHTRCVHGPDGHAWSRRRHCLAAANIGSTGVMVVAVGGADRWRVGDGPWHAKAWDYCGSKLTKGAVHGCCGGGKEGLHLRVWTATPVCDLLTPTVFASRSAAHHSDKFGFISPVPFFKYGFEVAEDDEQGCPLWAAWGVGLLCMYSASPLNLISLGSAACGCSIPQARTIHIHDTHQAFSAVVLRAPAGPFHPACLPAWRGDLAGK